MPQSMPNLQPLLGKNLRRLTQGRSVSEIAKLTGLSSVHIRRVLAGKHNPTEETIELLCRRLGIRAGDLHPDLRMLQRRFAETRFDSPDLTRLVRLACEATRNASFPALAQYGGLEVVTPLSTTHNPSTNLDVQATSTMIRTLSPGLLELQRRAKGEPLRFAIYGEELDSTPELEPTIVAALEDLGATPLLVRSAVQFSERLREGYVGVLLDALDGTVNAIARLPLFCSAIAFLEDGMPFLGAVYDPIRGEAYYALHPHGRHRGEAHLWNLTAGSSIPLGRGVPAQVAPIVAVHLTRGDPDARARLADFAGKLPTQYTVAALNSGQLALALVSAGKIAAYLNPCTSVWDCAAGEVLVRASGHAVMSTFDGEPIDYVSGERTTSVLAASTEKIHKELSERLESGYR
jgi:fructose-1,6-bisphosphatase/inositol monophosphatase family enzyme/transcriptional regulator with XRE-family HTH domain